MTTPATPRADHPHTDPGDGRTECDVCGKYVWPVIHSCKGVPVTARARARFEQRRADVTAPLLTITAYGHPAPQGSKRHVGRGVMVESSKRLKPWRDDVKAAAERFIESQRVRGLGWTPLDAPLAVSMVFTMPKPASAPKRRRTWPMRTPDLSKLIRSTEDALTDAGIWRDDARVVRYHDTGKAYPGEDDLALTSPGVVIRIWPLDEARPVVAPHEEPVLCRGCHACSDDPARPAVAPYLPAAATPEGIEDIALPGLEVAR